MEGRMSTSPDSPGVVALPPLIYGAAFLVVLVLGWIRPLPIANQALVLVAGLALIVLAIGIAIWCRRTMQAAGTNVNPSLPTTAIVTSGPFRYSRNPLYLALTLLFLGLALAFDT